MLALGLSTSFQWSCFSGLRDMGHDRLEATGGAGESGDDIRIETITEAREELAADTIAGIASISIALISTEFEGAGSEISEDMGPIKSEEGADVRVMLWEHARHTHRPSAADEIHE